MVVKGSLKAVQHYGKMLGNLPISSTEMSKVLGFMCDDLKCLNSFLNKHSEECKEEEVIKLLSLLRTECTNLLKMGLLAVVFGFCSNMVKKIFQSNAEGHVGMLLPFLYLTLILLFHQNPFI